MVSAKAMQCDMVIIGGGICGLLAARQCRDKGLSYTLIEREKRLGGNWHTKANDHSFLQAYEPMYRWDPKYKVHPSIFGKAPASKACLGLKLNLSGLTAET